ncbi:MAG TPA: hypothetical protein VGL58_04490 [Caulobacteraceae bacterium]|jgi:hypothetical protein
MAPTSALQVREASEARSIEARLRLMIASGGDDRLWLDPVTRRNRYGAPAAPAPDELWFSSSTACAVSPRGWAAASEALLRLTDAPACGLVSWFDDLRARLLSIYGTPGAQAVLTASGTEAELVTLTLALALAERPLTNIVIAPAETGSGVPAAAEGRHFLAHASLGVAVCKAARLPGWADADIRLDTIEIRLPKGRLRAQADVDQEAALKVERAVAAGGFALLHVLDASKTGRPGVSRAAAKAIVARHPGQALAVVDACQLRCSAAAVRADLEAGLVVMITGSKFAGGPAFCGALLLPPALAEELTATQLCGSPLAPYSAALDWPAPLRSRLSGALAHPANLGLGLRWSAALAEIEAYEAVPEPVRAALLADFDRAVRDRVRDDPALALLDGGIGGGAPGLTPVLHVDDADPRWVYEALQAANRPVHLGQPVTLGPRTVLRVCASMPMITAAASGDWAALETDLDEAFETWASL